MTVINLPLDQQRAITAIDVNSLQMAVEMCLREKRIGPVHELQLSECGDFVVSGLRAFERAVAAYSKAKAHPKVEQTRADALRAGGDLVYAIQRMKSRVATEQEQGEVFYVDDQLRAPNQFSKRLTVTVRYRWRPLPPAEWVHGTIAFMYDSSPLPNYTHPLPKRKVSAAKAASDEQERLYREWDDLKVQALCSLRDFFRNGGDGNDIPEKFVVRPSPHGGGLNNYSCNFWQSA